MYRSVVVALLALFLGGCAGMAGVAAPETAKAVEKARTVGVISAVGSKFALQKVGITVFGNEFNEVPAGSWGLDDAVTSRVSAVLSGRFAVKRISVPPGAFDDYTRSGGVFGDTDAALHATVRKVAGSANCDLYFVVTRAAVQFGGTNQGVAGVGLVEGGGAINPDNVTLFAVTAVHLYDGRTFERLSWHRPQFAIGAGKIVNGPHRTLDRTWWPATPQAVNSEKYKAATRALLTESVGAAVPEMLGLAGKKGGA
jgi:hypothetical protein